VTGSNFAPFSLTGNQSEGYVWYDVDEDYQFYSDPDEPKIKVYVLSDGTLSRCASSACAVPNPFNGRLWGRVRVDISHEALSGCLPPTGEHASRVLTALAPR
jgi:hypothetical protein